MKFIFISIPHRTIYFNDFSPHFNDYFQVLIKFQDLVSACIYGTSCIPNKSSLKSLDLESIITEKANQKNLTENEEWFAKCLQLNNLANNFDGNFFFISFQIQNGSLPSHRH